MKLGQLLDAKIAFTNISRVDMSVPVAWKIAKIISKLGEDEKLFKEQQIALFKKYGEEKDKDNMVIKPENISIYRTELETLLEVDTGYEPQIKIKISEFGDIKLQPSDLIKIEAFLDTAEEINYDK